MAGARREVRCARYSALTGAQARPPASSSAHAVPAQQPPDIQSHGSPGGAQSGSGAAPAGTTQTVAPGAPTHAPLQQSCGAVQPAPAGAQASRQAKPPEPSGRQRPPQHCSATEQG